MLGTLAHLGLDALLFSAFLAGIKRNTGLTPALSQVPNKDIRQLLRSYLEFGEYVFDFAVVIFGASLSFSKAVARTLKLHTEVGFVREKALANVPSISDTYD